MIAIPLADYQVAFYQKGPLRELSLAVIGDLNANNANGVAEIGDFQCLHSASYDSWVAVQMDCSRLGMLASYFISWRRDSVDIPLVPVELKLK